MASTRYRWSLGVSLAVISALAVLPAAAQADGYEVVTAFEASADELPEGLSIASDGAMYVTLGSPFFIGSVPGAVRRITADGTSTTLAEFPDGAPAGIVAGPDGNVFVARPNPGLEDSRGVYRLVDGSEPELMAGTEELLVANGLALDGAGNLFASDSITGTVWRIPLDGSSPEPWYAEPSLIGGCGGDGEVGANGIAFAEDGLYVASTSRGLLVRVPIEDDGSAGIGQVVAGDATNGCEPDALFGMDGIAVASDGAVYAALVLQHQVVRIDPSDGSFEVLLSADDGLHNPASLAFGTLEDDRASLYITNYAVLPPAPEDSPGPAVLRFESGVDGVALP